MASRADQSHTRDEDGDATTVSPEERQDRPDVLPAPDPDPVEVQPGRHRGDPDPNEVVPDPTASATGGTDSLAADQDDTAGTHHDDQSAAGDG